MNSIKRTSAALGLATALALSLAACAGTSAGSPPASSAPSSAAPSEPAPTTSPSPTMSTMDPAANLVGPGCADYAKANPSGPASVEGMSTAPVVTAAASNPLLTTLASAVSGKLNPKVNLVQTLNGSEFTVFAPVDSAFAKIDPATIESLKTDDATLTKILTYHVVPGQAAPSALPGEHTTVQGGTVTVTGSGDTLKVNDAAVVCGGVKTANATVYLIDTVLMPAQ